MPKKLRNFIYSLLNQQKVLLVEFNQRHTVIIAILVYFLGKYLVERSQLLQHYNIPVPVVGGIIASFVSAFIYFSFDIELTYSLFQRDVLLVIFFTCIGLSSRFSSLIKGGRSLVIMLVLAVTYLFIQNLTGIIVSSLAGLPSQVGVLSGSVSLSGGHGTAIAWAPVFVEKYGINTAVEIGIACATFGLVLGGIIGGPISNYLISKHKLSGPQHQELAVGVENEQKTKITVDSVFSVLLVVSIAVGIGLQLHQLLITLGIKLPVFVPCLFGGILLTNTIPLIFKRISWPTGTPTLALASDITLGLFLSMSLMSLKLWELIDLAGPILLLLLAQVVVITLFTVFIVFRLLGRNYEAAVMSSGYAGLALGATPTAIANMTAVTKKSGAAPQAFIVIPLIGAFFIDIANSVIIQSLLRWLG